MNWLVKEEPSNYNFEQFVKDGKTTWTGVKNPLALKHLRGMSTGDRVFYYHTGGEKAIVGVATVASSGPGDDGEHVVQLIPGTKLAAPVTLAAIKADPRFADFLLVRMARLSVMPVTDQQWAWIESMSRA